MRSALFFFRIRRERRPRRSDRRRRLFGMCEEEGPGSIFHVIARAKPVVTEGNACGAIRSPSGPSGTGRCKAPQGMRIATENRTWSFFW